jgi:hypothetical protein
MAYDGTRVILLNYDGTWLYDGIDWSASPITPPNGSSYLDATMARDVGTGSVIMFDNLSSPKTWRWNSGTLSWADVTPSVSPPRRDNSTMAYCADVGGLIMFCGADNDNRGMADMWYWDDAASQWNRIWHRTELDINSINASNAMVWDSSRNRIVIAGFKSLQNTYEIVQGTPPSSSQDWFSFNGESYNLDTGVSGPVLLPKYYGVAAYDSIRSKVVYVNGGWYDEYGTWELDVSSNVWANVTSVPSHPHWAGRDEIPGSWASACFETVNNNTVVCVGNPWDATGANGELSIYTWNGSVWTQQTTTGSTVHPCIHPQIVWDESRNLIWGFCGYWVFTTMYTLVWHLDPSTWNITALVQGGGGYFPGGPTASVYAYAVGMVDWKDNKKALLMTRGIVPSNLGYGPPPPSNSVFFNETWVVEESSPSTYTWTQLTEVGTLPVRGYADCVIDGDTVYIVGGMINDPFDPVIRTDTYTGVVDPVAETITWNNKAVSPPSRIGWGTLLVKV